MSLEHSPARAGLRILRLKHVCARYHISPSTVWQWTKEGRLPQPVEFGPNTRGWFEHELDERDLERARARDQQATAEELSGEIPPGMVPGR